MKIPKPRAVQFQIAVRARLPRGKKYPSGRAVSELVRRWTETGNLPDEWEIRIMVWEYGKKREVEAGNDARGSILRATLWRALQDGRLTIKKVGRTR